MSKWTFRLVSGEDDDGDTDLDAVRSHAAVAVGHELYCFGGKFPGRNQMSVDAFDTATLRWRKMRPARGRGGGGRGGGGAPPVLQHHTAVLIYQHVYVWGGWDELREEYSGGALYAFDVDAHRWRKTGRASGSVPPGRRGHSACAVGNKATFKMYVYGGYQHDDWDEAEDVVDASSMCDDTIYALDVASMVWCTVTVTGDRPPVTIYHSATVHETMIFVFGGKDSRYCYGNVRSFDTEIGRWMFPVRDATPDDEGAPSARWDHAAFIHDDELYVFGGVSERRDVCLNDLWKFDLFQPLAWQAIKPKGKGPEASSTVRMRCCMVGGRAVVTGRGDASSHLYLLEVSPRLATLCKMAVVGYGLEESTLPHNVRWELAARRPAEKMDDLPGKESDRATPT